MCPKLYLGPCSSVGMRQGTVTHTLPQRHTWPIYISRRLWLTRKVTSVCIWVNIKCLELILERLNAGVVAYHHVWHMMYNVQNQPYTTNWHHKHQLTTQKAPKRTKHIYVAVLGKRLVLDRHWNFLTENEIENASFLMPASPIPYFSQKIINELATYNHASDEITGIWFYCVIR